MPSALRTVCAIAFFATVLAMIGDLVNGRFWASDFRVYYEAAHALRDAGQVYGLAFGENTGFYKYAPMVALLFIPATWLPFQVAAMIHVLFSATALAITFRSLERVLMRHVFQVYAPRVVLRGVITLACIVVLLVREVHLANINLWLVCCVVLGVEALWDDRSGSAGVFFGLVWLVKPYLLLLGVPLLVWGRWAVLWRAAAVCAVAVILPFLVVGPGVGWRLHRAWLEAMAAHGSYLTSPDTLLAMVGRATGTTMPAWAGPSIIALAVLVVGAMAWRARGGSYIATVFSQRQALCILIAFALVPNLVITDQEHFLYALPLIAWAVADLFQRPGTWRTMAFIASMLLYATRSSDLWGNSLEANWVGLGALGLGNLAIVCYSALVLGRQQ